MPCTEYPLKYQNSWITRSFYCRKGMYFFPIYAIANEKYEFLPPYRRRSDRPDSEVVKKAMSFANSELENGLFAHLRAATVLEALLPGLEFTA